MRDFAAVSNSRIAMIDSTERIRVLMVNSTLHIGGAERIIASLAQHLDRSRFEVSACYLKENGLAGEEMLRAGVELTAIPNFKGKHDHLTAFKLLNLIKARQIQILHTHDLHGLMDACICKILMPSLRHVHTFHFGNYPHLQPKYKFIERLLWRIPDALVAVGHEQAATIRNLYGIPAHRLHVLWNGVNAPIADIAPEVRAILTGDTRPVIVSVSTLIPQKGLHLLLEAAALLRDRNIPYVLLIAGNGPLKQSLQQLAASLRLENHVRFLGWVSDAARRVLPAGDIFVQSSLWEAMSVVVLEAMSVGKSIAATNVGENRHVIEDEVSGLCVPPGDREALANALAKLLLQPTLRQSLGAAAHERYSEQFTVQHMIDRYQTRYTQLLCASKH
jgi:glycosyltransferase involved in cell wall biosynthesis